MERFVYLLKAGEDHYKVGVALDVLERIRSIQTGNPLKIELVAVVHVPEAQATEHKLHVWLAKNKSGGGTEWFKLTPMEALELVTKMTSLSITSDISRYLTMRNIVIRQTKLEREWEDFKAKVVKEDEPKKPHIVDQTTDELLPEATKIVSLAGQASTSMLQRKLRIGYARAARIVDELCEAGIIGEADGARPRELLIESTPHT